MRGCWEDMFREDHTMELAKIKHPVLIVWGTSDLLFQAVEQERLKSALTSTTPAFVAVPGATHDSLLLNGFAMSAVGAWVQHMEPATPEQKGLDLPDATPDEKAAEAKAEDASPPAPPQ